MLKGYFSICIYIEETIILEEMLYGKLKKKRFLLNFGSILHEATHSSRDLFDYTPIS